MAEDIGCRKAFISYLNDDDVKISGYFDLIEIGDAFVVFESRGSRISVPAARVLKIKEKVGGSC